MKDVGLLKFKDKGLRHGQTLVLLLVLMTTGVVITSAAVMIIIANSQAASKFSSGEAAYSVAESGAENAILRLIRNPNYTGEILTVGGGEATIIVSGSTTKTIVSEGVVGNFRRKVQIVGTYVNNIFTPSSWDEID